VASRSERVLVTGSRGFTGRYLCEHLRKNGYEVIGLVDSMPSSPGEVAADIRCASATDEAVESIRPDLVVHLAAVSFVADEDIEGVYRTNLLGSLALLRALAARPASLRCVILASSANVYGNVEQPVIDESVPCAPTSHYAISKLAMEYMAGTFADRLPIVITRAFNYTGPGQPESFLVPKIVDHFRRRADAIELGNIDVIRDFMDVRTVVDVYRRLLACPAALGQTVNICSGQGISLREVISLLEAETGHRLEIRVNPKFVRAREVRRLVGSPQKLRSLVGEGPVISFTATLRDMLAQR
jgi:nucleoside-diphosphate-sugar epimerase